MVTRLLVLLTMALVVASGCAGQAEQPAALPSAPPSRLSTESTPTTPAAVSKSIALADGVTLRPGVDGRLPVTVRWIHQGWTPETFAVDRRRHLLYLSDDRATALRLSDGSVRWQVGSPPNSVLEGGLFSDGGDVIGGTGRGGVRFFAPYNFDLTVNPKTGERIAYQYIPGDVPRDLRPFPNPRPKHPRISVELDGVVARGTGDRAAWRITVRTPMYSHAGPVAVPGGVAVLLSSGLVVVLDWNPTR